MRERKRKTDLVHAENGMRSEFMENLIKYLYYISSIIWKCWISTKSVIWNEPININFIRLKWYDSSVQLSLRQILEIVCARVCVWLWIFARAYNLVVLLMFRSYFANLLYIKGKWWNPQRNVARRKPYNCRKFNKFSSCRVICERATF